MSKIRSFWRSVLKRDVMRQLATSILAACCVVVQACMCMADPCGMVPPIYVPQGEAGIVRDGLQQTYVFYKDGIETLVIHPGFQGEVGDFGMLIPFPSPPAIRKVPDNTFQQLKAAIDPPEIIVDLTPNHFFGGQGYGMGGFGGMGGYGGGMGGGYGGESGELAIQRDETRVLKEEAVGMYDVVVLQAGSSEALQRWMTENQYRYPEGMDSVCEEYVEAKWCFVAVRARIAHKHLVDPKPGQRDVQATLQPGASFDGHVQAMGFRFYSDLLTVPMRLSTYNEGDLHNIVYLLTDNAAAINGIDKELVVRQVSGKELVKNISSPLPLRVLGGSIDEIPEIQKRTLRTQRDSSKYVASAIELFQGDLRCVLANRLTNEEEEFEKSLLSISEHLGLRGEAIDALHRTVATAAEEEELQAAWPVLEEMTLTVIDGDFPRELLANENLTFMAYKMPSRLNSPRFYHAREHGPVDKPEGILHEGTLSAILPIKINSIVKLQSERNVAKSRSIWIPLVTPKWIRNSGALLACSALFFAFTRRRKTVLSEMLASRGSAANSWPWWRFASFFVFAIVAANVTFGQAGRLANKASVSTWLNELGDEELAESAADNLVSLGNRVVPQLVRTVAGDDLLRQGWAIVCLQRIGSPAAIEQLGRLTYNKSNSRLVDVWLQAALINTTTSLELLIDSAEKNGVPEELERPYGQKLSELVRDDLAKPSIVKLIKLTQQAPAIAPQLNQMILAVDASELVLTGQTVRDQDMRRQATAYLATKAQQSYKEVAQAVIARLQYRSSAEEVPWEGGALFLPSMAWKPADATAAVVELSQWMLWCERNKKTSQLRVILNNLNDIGRVGGLGQANTGMAALASVAHELSFSQFWQIVTEHRLTTVKLPASVNPEGGDIERAYVLEGGSRSPQLGWRVQQGVKRSLITFASQRGVELTWRPNEQIYAVGADTRLQELASVNGRYRDLMHQVNAPFDRSFTGLFSEVGLYESQPGYRGHKKLEKGYWVYLYPTWYIWREHVNQ